jgi:hypothetical protein
VSPIWNWTPIYRSGFSWNLGYVYDPWGPWGYYGFYGGRYGPWFYPYYPYGYYDPFYGYPYSGGGVYYRGSDNNDNYGSRPAKQELGALRVKASPNTAKVYVDGTLMGVVDDFDGLTNHLELEPGMHRLELRAEGYETVSKDVTVTTKTTTVRFSLKKK